MGTNAAAEILNAPDAPLPVRDSSEDAVVVTTSSSSAGHKAADALGIIREWQKVHQLTATDCCCCGASLTDAVSVNRGIGPVCSSKHYEIDFPITKYMVENALGTLQASSLDKLVKRAAKALKTKPRDLCNVLIWWSSAHLDETATVLDCAEIVTCLGFDDLGDRLRERNTNVIVTKDGDDHFIIRCRSKMSVRRNMAAVKGASAVGRLGRFKYGWRVANTDKALVWTILGEDFGNEFATVPDTATASKVVKIDLMSWWQVRDALRAANTPAAPANTPLPNIVRPGQAGWLEVHTPNRNFAFISELKAKVNYKDRTWNRDKVCWTVRARFETNLRALVKTHFGRE